MTLLELFCPGQASEKHRAELATLQIDVRAKESTQEAATRNVTQACNSLRNRLNFNIAYKDGVESSYLQQLTTYGRSDYSSSGHVIKTWRHASTSMTVNFHDFEAMSNAVSEFATMDFVTIDRIGYSLRAETRTRLEAELRKRAIQNAMDTARIYFQASSVQEFQLTEIVDTHAGNNRTKFRMGRSGGTLFGASADAQDPTASGLNFEPEDLSISVNINVKFQAEAPTLH